MYKRNYQKAQAAIELAVFGAILIFILGTVIRSAIGNSYQQNQTYKAMRMAMMASYNSSKSTKDSSATPLSLARNSASITFLEDRISADTTKYGSLERSPEMANGAGSFSYQMLYPLDATEVGANLPIMDVYINGQHFPFTTASYVTNQNFYPTTVNSCGAAPGPGSGPYTTPPLTSAQCTYNQCLRNVREWVTDSGGTYKLFYSQAVNGTPQFSLTPPSCNPPSSCKDQALSSAQVQTDSATGAPYTNTSGDMEFDLQRNGNYAAVEAVFPYNSAGACIDSSGNSVAGPCTCPATCTNTCTGSCINNVCTGSGATGSCAVSCSQEKDNTYTSLGSQYTCPAPTAGHAASSLRADMAWQWYATAATTASNIGLDTDKQQYPAYDVDGRLKTVTIYSISSSTAPGAASVTISYEDPQGGDIDSSWDSSSCGPKPGLQNQFQIYTFTQNGTYLQIKEGKLYNPETGQVVRSVSQRNNADLIQRTIQLSNNTGRFCSGTTPLATVANDGVTPNPVEVCASGTQGDTCFSSQKNIKSTCFDLSDNIIYVRSRLVDRGGRFWITDASGPLGIK